MIQVTRINRLPVVLNSDLIEHLESAPDTIITLTNGQKMVVLEPVEEIIRRVVEFRRMIFAGFGAPCPASTTSGPATGPCERALRTSWMKI